MKRFNYPDRPAVLHYITINIRDKRKAFVRDAFARVALELLREYCDRHPAKLHAYVVMSDHLHFVFNPRDGKCTRFLRQYKPAVTQAIADMAETLALHRITDWLRKPDGTLQLWQEGRHSFPLYSDRLIWQKIDYIHNNPIRSGLVQKASDYPYSSFRAMYDGFGEPIVPIDRDFWWEEGVG